MFHTGKAYGCLLKVSRYGDRELPILALRLRFYNATIVNVFDISFSPARWRARAARHPTAPAAPLVLLLLLPLLLLLLLLLPLLLLLQYRLVHKKATHKKVV